MFNPQISRTMIYNIPTFVSRSEMNKVPISDLLTAMRFPYYEQVQSLRHYHAVVNANGFIADFTVNMARNEWISRKDGVHGQTAELIDYLNFKPRDFDGNYHDHMELMLNAYQESETLPGSFPTTTVRLGKFRTTLTDDIDESVYELMTRHGISTDVLDQFCKQVEVNDPQKSKDKYLLAFPADNDNWMVFCDTAWRPYDESTITTIGKIKKNQYCFVYDSPSDFLAMMEMWHKNQVSQSFSSTYHLIINGRQNIEKAQQFIRDNPDFLSVKTFFPNTADGRQMFKDINDACKGTAVNRSDIFKGYESLASRMRMQMPSDIYEKYVVKMSDNEEAISPSLKDTNRLTTDKTSNSQCLTNQSSEEGQLEAEKSDKIAKGTGPVQNLTLEPKHKGWGL